MNVFTVAVVCCGLNVTLHSETIFKDIKNMNKRRWNCGPIKFFWNWISRSFPPNILFLSTAIYFLKFSYYLVRKYKRISFFTVMILNLISRIWIAVGNFQGYKLSSSIIVNLFPYDCLKSLYFLEKMCEMLHLLVKYYVFVIIYKYRSHLKKL